MSELLTDEEMEQLKPAQGAIFPSPIPTIPISNGEFMPGPQTECPAQSRGAHSGIVE